jgi:UDP-N-acetylmuramoylalanine--D-glutamate ligase
MSRFSGKTVAIVGLSVEGRDTLEYFRHQDCTLICVDQKETKETHALSDAYAGSGISFYFGNEYLEHITDADCIVCTPGISPRTEALVKARLRKTEITSSIQLFFELCKGTIIGVTGTKGKGTTSTLIYEMLRKKYAHVFLGGNVGIPLLSKVDEIASDDWVVLELSSFQLEYLRMSPHIAVILRITQDHLANFDKNATNFHATREAYVEAKSQIVRHQRATDVAIINDDDETARSFVDLTPAKIIRFNRYQTNADSYVDHHAVFANIDGVVKEICTRENIHLKGDHNLENIAAATLAAISAGVSYQDIVKAVKNFQGLEHRLEFVKTVAGVSYYDDSFSTVPETTIAAVESFEEPKVLILGGSEKMSDFTDMGKKIASANVIGVVVIGQMTKRITDCLTNASYKGKVLTGSTTMHEIVKQASSIAPPGSVVLLSPACASFDMFNNYKERGTLFQHEVHALT